MNIIKAKVLIICDVDKVIFISVMLSSIGRKVKQYGILLLEQFHIFGLLIYHDRNKNIFTKWL